MRENILCFRKKFLHLQCKNKCGISSVVEHHLAKVGVAGPNPVFRSSQPIIQQNGWFFV